MPVMWYGTFGDVSISVLDRYEEDEYGPRYIPLPGQRYSLSVYKSDGDEDLYAESIEVYIPEHIARGIVKGINEA